MRKNIEKVIDAYKQGKAAKGDSKATCSTDGQRIFSYRTVIAERQEDGSTKIMPEGPWSRTSQGQVRALELTFGKANK